MTWLYLICIGVWSYTIFLIRFLLFIHDGVSILHYNYSRMSRRVRYVLLSCFLIEVL